MSAPGAIAPPFINRAIDGAGLDSATQALLDQADTDGFTPASGAVLTALNTFIVDLKDESIWDELDAIWLPATNGDSDFATYNLKDPTVNNLTKVSSPTFTSLEGFDGDGASSYIDTNFSPLTDGVNFIQNSASMGFYNRVDTTGELGGMMIARDTVPDVMAQILQNSGLYSGLLNNTSASGNNPTLADNSGFTHQNRDGTTLEVFLNAVSEDSDIIATVAPVDLDIYILCRNQNDVAGIFSSLMQVSMAFFGAELSSKVSEFRTAIQDYMTSIGSEV